MSGCIPEAWEPILRPVVEEYVSKVNRYGSYIDAMILLDQLNERYGLGSTKYYVKEEVIRILNEQWIATELAKRLQGKTPSRVMTTEAWQASS
jgi:hypothetical protein